MKPPREVVRDWVAAYNHRDTHAAAALYHEDATNFQVALGAPSVGRQTILDDLLSFFRAFPDNFTRVENLLEDGEWVMLEWLGGVLGGGNLLVWLRTVGHSRYVAAGSSTLLVARSASNADISTRPPGLVNWASHSCEEDLILSLRCQGGDFPETRRPGGIRRREPGVIPRLSC
jgi:hypothetical protein